MRRNLRSIGTLTLTVAVTYFIFVTSSLAQSTLIIEYFEAHQARDQAAIDEAADQIISADPSELALQNEDFYDLVIEIGDAQLDAGDFARAEVTYRRALSFSEQVFGPGSLRNRTALRAIGALKIEVGEIQEAERILLRSLELAESVLGSDSLSLREELELLGSIPIEPPINETGPHPSDRIQGYRTRLFNLTQRANMTGVAPAQEGLDTEAPAQEGLAVMRPFITNVSRNRCDDHETGELVVEERDVFYATNRVRSDRMAPNKFFKNEHDTGAPLKYGVATVTLPCERDFGDVPRPWIKVFGVKVGDSVLPERRSEHVVLENVREIHSESTFWSEVAGKVSAHEEKEALVFVHGFHTEFRGAAYRTAQLAADLDLRGAALIYDWASSINLGILPRHYREERDLATSENVAEELADFLNGVASNTGATHITVIAYSLGNEPLLRALMKLREPPFQNVNEPLFQHVVFGAPDVPIDSYEGFARNVQGLAHGMTMYTSTLDLILMLVPAFDDFILRAGDGNNAVVVDGIDTINTAAVSRGAGHGDFLNGAFDDVRAALWFNASPEARCVLGVIDQIRLIWGFQPRCDNEAFREASLLLRKRGFAQANSDLDASQQTPRVDQIRRELHRLFHAVNPDLLRQQYAAIEMNEETNLAQAPMEDFEKRGAQLRLAKVPKSQLPID